MQVERIVKYVVLNGARSIWTADRMDEPLYKPLPVKFAQAGKCRSCGGSMKGSGHHNYCNKCRKKHKELDL